jgi:hypothetical protein
VLGQVGLAQKDNAQVVVANDVPPVQSMLVAQVWDELSHRHASTCPWDDALRIDLKRVGHQNSHSLFFNIELVQKICRAHSLEWSFAFFKASGLWNGGALNEGIEMAIHFYRNARDMSGDLMGGPSIA